MGIADFLPSGNERLDRQLKFTAEIDRMTGVLRRTLLVDGSRRENDAEHSWHIAAMALLFEEHALQKPDVARAVQMCIVHDLVEIYAGDTFAFDEEAQGEKESRERIAADRLFSQLPPEQGAAIRSLWEEFDGMQTADPPREPQKICIFQGFSLTLQSLLTKGCPPKRERDPRATLLKKGNHLFYNFLNSHQNASFN